MNKNIILLLLCSIFVNAQQLQASNTGEELIRIRHTHNYGNPCTDPNCRIPDSFMTQREIDRSNYEFELEYEIYDLESKAGCIRDVAEQDENKEYHEILKLRAQDLRNLTRSTATARLIKKHALSKDSIKEILSYLPKK